MGGANLGHPHIAGKRLLVAGHGPQSEKLLASSHFWAIFHFFGYYEDGPSILEKWVYNFPIF